MFTWQVEPCPVFAFAARRGVGVRGCETYGVCLVYVAGAGDLKNSVNNFCDVFSGNVCRRHHALEAMFYKFRWLVV